MASSAPATVVLFLAVLSLLSAYASARPGIPFNTVFVSYTITTTASSDDALPGLHQTSVFVSVYRIIAPIRNFHPDSRPTRIARPALLPRREVVPAEPAALGFSSLHDRAKDVLVVVIGLLFGVGCGAITAATMCLAWSLVTHRHEICGSDEYSDEEEGADESPKAGYVRVPAADPVSVN
ncbi:uncharacterized protein LOC135587512 [Musa acuminata AAA Group]|uniref:(wild Malaysian banana) hypothetical protein n=1 Tax=Musa acuminata subsp. malaccensis TaxID=214687 RepID=A0A804K675_MUSAM|nr:PREDICTED: uncharacterized protein LOC103994476 [Musa acuminata subsp. malaccensis]CAG1831446.1 unnamed protein product [Musa acuminata subsp. malaccensis]